MIFQIGQTETKDKILNESKGSSSLQSNLLLTIYLFMLSTELLRHFNIIMIILIFIYFFDPAYENDKFHFIE